MKAITIIATFAFILLLIFIFNPCKINSLDINRYNSKFELNKAEFEQLVDLLKTQNLKTGYPINTSMLSKEIKRLLQTLEISDVNTLAANCAGKVVYEFTTSWSSVAVYHFP